MKKKTQKRRVEVKLQKKRGGVEVKKKSEEKTPFYAAALNT